MGGTSPGVVAVPVNRFRAWLAKHNGLVVAVYLVALPTAIVVLAGVATYNLSRNHAQDHQQSQAIAQNRTLIRANCERSQALLDFIGMVIFSTPGDPVLAKMQDPYLQLVQRYLDTDPACPLPPHAKRPR